MRRIRTAVIGCGRFGRRYVEKLAAMPQVALVAVVDPDLAAARAAAAPFGVLALSDYPHVLAEVDAACIVTPAASHYSIARDCLIAGVDVLIEKPAAPTAAQVEQLAALAESRHRIAQVDHIERFNPALAALPPAADLQRLRCVRATAASGRATDVDVALDLMIHDIDLACWLFRAEPTRVSASGVIGANGVVDALRARLEFPGGRRADLLARRDAPRAARSLTASYPDGRVELDLSPSAGGRDALTSQLSAFLDAVAERTEPPVGLADGARAVRIAQALITGARIRPRLPIALEAISRRR